MWHLLLTAGKPSKLKRAHFVNFSFKFKNKRKFQERDIFLSSNLSSVWILMHRAALGPLTDMGLSDKDIGLFVSGQRHLGVEIKIV